MRGKQGLKAKKQPYAYAKKGNDGKWYHWRVLGGRLAQGAALGIGFGLGKLLFGNIFSDIFEGGLVGDVVEEIKGWFS